MLLNGKLIRYFRHHSERIIEYSQASALYNYYLLMYSWASVVLLLVGIIWFSEPPTALIGFVLDIFLQSPFVVIALLTLTLIIYKIDLINWLSYLDPHDDHPFIDLILGALLFVIGTLGLGFFISESEAFPELNSTGLVDLLPNLIILIGLYSLAMFLCAIIVNGLCRFIFNSLSAVLHLEKIRHLPQMLIKWYRVRLTRIRHVVDTYKTITIYAAENDKTTFAAVVDVFESGFETIEPLHHQTTSEVSEENVPPSDT